MTQHNQKITPPTFPYIVQAGDTLSGIAQRAYGNGSQPYWMALFAAQWGAIGNDPNVITPGQQLSIPAIKENPSVDGDSLYIVKAGDTLWGIAESYIHSSGPGFNPDVQLIVETIYSFNKAEIGGNPNLIRLGQVLFIPGGQGGGGGHM
jgi:nucleoid-associated protein YgaU